MVVFVDLEDAVEDPRAGHSLHALLPIIKGGSIAASTRLNGNTTQHLRPNPNLNAVSTALGCYPYNFSANALELSLIDRD